MKRRRDHLDGAAMLDAIEEEVVPLYYARNSSGFSPEWVRRCRHAMATVIPHFNMRRMVRDYARGMYLPAAAHGRSLLENAGAGALELSRWKERCASAGTVCASSRCMKSRAAAGTASPLQHARARAAGRARAARPARGVQGATAAARSAVRCLRRCARSVMARPPGQWRAEFEPVGPVAADGTVIYEVAAVPPGTGPVPARGARVSLAPAAEASRLKWV